MSQTLDSKQFIKMIISKKKGYNVIIENRIKEIELEYNKSVVTYVKGFDRFYKAEDYHQNYYQTNFINYLLYKKGCGRENRLEQIWEK